MDSFDDAQFLMNRKRRYTFGKESNSRSSNPAVEEVKIGHKTLIEGNNILIDSNYH
jgi:hypothetical protein